MAPSIYWPVRWPSSRRRLEERDEGEVLWIGGLQVIQGGRSTAHARSAPVRTDVFPEDCVTGACGVHLYCILTELLTLIIFGIEGESPGIAHQNNQSGYCEGLNDWAQGGCSHRLRRCERWYNNDASKFIGGRLYSAAIEIDILEVLGIT